MDVRPHTVPGFVTLCSSVELWPSLLHVVSFTAETTCEVTKRCESCLDYNFWPTFGSNNLWNLRVHFNCKKLYGLVTDLHVSAQECNLSDCQTKCGPSLLQLREVANWQNLDGNPCYMLSHLTPGDMAWWTKTINYSTFNGASCLVITVKHTLDVLCISFAAVCWKMTGGHVMLSHNLIPVLCKIICLIFWGGGCLFLTYVSHLSVLDLQTFL